MSAPEQVIATSSRVDFRRLLNTFGFAGEWVLIINHGLRFAGSVQRLGSDFYQIGTQLFSLATVTDIHFTGQGEIIVAIERPMTDSGQAGQVAVALDDSATDETVRVLNPAIRSATPREVLVALERATA